MSWSFVLSTVIYYSFSFIDVYELKHKMILKCGLIETAVDTVTMITGAPSAAERPWIKVCFSLVLEAARGKVSLKINQAGAKEIRRFIFIGGGGKGARPLTGYHTAAPGFLGLDIQGLAFLLW